MGVVSGGENPEKKTWPTLKTRLGFATNFATKLIQKQSDIMDIYAQDGN